MSINIDDKVVTLYQLKLLYDVLNNKIEKLTAIIEELESPITLTGDAYGNCTISSNVTLTGDEEGNCVMSSNAELIDDGYGNCTLQKSKSS